jgi:hypothetical protein
MDRADKPLLQSFDEEDSILYNKFDSINEHNINRTPDCRSKSFENFNTGTLSKAEVYAYRHAYGEYAESDSSEEDIDEDTRKKIADATPQTKRRLRSEADEKHTGKIGPLSTFFTLIKGFVATGVLFLPKGWVNGGWLFSS